MLTREQALKIRKAIWNDSAAYGKEHQDFCEEHGLDESEVWQFLDGAVDFFTRREEQWREAHALKVGVTIDTNTQKKDGSFVSQVSVVASNETYARILLARGKALTAIVYDPQEELPLDYGSQGVPSDQGELPMGGLLPEPVEVVAEEED